MGQLKQKGRHMVFLAVPIYSATNVERVSALSLLPICNNKASTFLTP